MPAERNSNPGHQVDHHHSWQRSRSARTWPSQGSRSGWHIRCDIDWKQVVAKLSVKPLQRIMSPLASHYQGQGRPKVQQGGVVMTACVAPFPQRCRRRDTELRSKSGQPAERKHSGTVPGCTVLSSVEHSWPHACQKVKVRHWCFMSHSHAVILWWYTCYVENHIASVRSVPVEVVTTCNTGWIMCMCSNALNSTLKINLKRKESQGRQNARIMTVYHWCLMPSQSAYSPQGKIMKNKKQTHGEKGRGVSSRRWGRGGGGGGGENEKNKSDMKEGGGVWKEGGTKMGERGARERWRGREGGSKGGKIAFPGIIFTSHCFFVWFVVWFTINRERLTLGLHWHKHAHNTLQPVLE